MRSNTRHIGGTTGLPQQPVLLRSMLFILVVWFFWISLQPFPDLSDPRLAEPDFKGNALNQAAAITLTALCVIYALSCDLRRWLVVVTLPFIALMTWLALSSALSPMPAVALKKLVLALFIAINAATLLLLPVSKRHFALLLTLSLGGALVASFYGVTFIPQRAIHQANEIVEPQLAGNWRGVFQHKNEAGTASVLIALVAIMVWRSFSRLAGAGLMIGGLTLMAFSGSKSAFGLLIATLAAAAIILRTRQPTLRLLVAAAFVAIPASFTIGSAFLPPVHNALAAIGIDPTFTARTDIWRIAVSATFDSPVFGHGFQVYWGTANVATASNQLGDWAVKATSAHNAYLELMVWAGFPGLLLTLWWVVIQPARDLTRAQATNADPDLTTFFTQVWVYALLSGALESIFFVGGGPIWVTLLMCMFGLRYQAYAALSGDNAAKRPLQHPPHLTSQATPNVTPPVTPPVTIGHLQGAAR